MDLNAHLLPEVKAAMKKAGAAVDESVVMDNTLTKKFESRNKPEKLEWFQDAGLGLFIHWSIDAQLGCVISHSLVGASEGYVDRFYEELPKTLEKGSWDFDHLASLAKLAGFQYAVLTTKHHCGFCLWDTQTTDFNIMNTAVSRDLVRAFAEAFRGQGIKVGFYFSPEDFCFLRGEHLTITRTITEPYAPEVMARYRDFVGAQMHELLTNYGPVDVMFFDGGESMIGEDGVSLQQYCLNLAWDLQPDVLITRGAIPTPEQQLPGVGAEEAWEACITLGTAWQHQPTNEHYKTGAQLIRMLVDTRAKGGTLLLNVGPDARGALCAEQEGLLRELALWHFINGECIHGVRPWTLVRENEIYLLKKKDGSALYAVIAGEKNWKRGERREFVLTSVGASASSQISVLGASGELVEYRPDLDAAPKLWQEADGLHLSVMKSQRIYCGIEWENPLVVRITDPVSTFKSFEIETLPEKAAWETDPQTGKAKAALHFAVRSLGSFGKALARVEIRKYPGFALSSYGDPKDWTRIELGRELSETGEYEIAAEGLEPGIPYQYQPVIYNDLIEVRGEYALLTVPMEETNL